MNITTILDKAIKMNDQRAEKKRIRKSTSLDRFAQFVLDTISFLIINSVSLLVALYHGPFLSILKHLDETGKLGESTGFQDTIIYPGMLERILWIVLPFVITIPLWRMYVAYAKRKEAYHYAKHKSFYDSL